MKYNFVLFIQNNSNCDCTQRRSKAKRKKNLLIMPKFADRYQILTAVIYFSLKFEMACDIRKIKMHKECLN